MDEAGLRQKLLEAGLDFRRTAAEYAEQFGPTRFFNFMDVVYLPAAAVITPFPLRFYVVATEAVFDQPAAAFSADFNLEAEAERNFRALRDAVTTVLGDGVDATVSNCLGRAWTRGAISVTVRAWPPELNRRIQNVVWEADPASRHKASVEVATSVPCLTIDPKLAAVLALPNTDRVEMAATQWNVTPQTPQARLNPDALVAAIGSGQVVAWRDQGRGRVGLTGREVSLAFEARWLDELRHVIVRPGRGAGYEVLELAYRNSRGKAVSMTLATRGEDDVLPAIGERLSKFWGVPLRVEYGIDD